MLRHHYCAAIDMKKCIHIAEEIDTLKTVAVTVGDENEDGMANREDGVTVHCDTTNNLHKLEEAFESAVRCTVTNPGL